MTRFWRLNPRPRAFALIAMGGAAGLGQAPTDLWPLTIAILATAFYLTQSAPRPTAIPKLWFCVGLGYFGVSLRWIVEPFLVDLATHGWMAPFALVLMAGGAALFWWLGATVATRLGGLWALVGALTLVEALRSLVLSGFPWALIGHVWIGTPMAQLASIIGPHGLSLLTFALAASIALVARGRWLATAVPVACMVLWPLLAPGPSPSGEGGRPVVRLVHPDIPQTEKWDPALRALNFDAKIAMTQGGSRPDLIVWPESAITQLLEHADLSLQVLAEAAKGVPVITGVQRRASDQVYHNSLIVLERGANVRSVYDKQHLVPFGEYFPGGEIAARLGLRGLASSEGGGFTPGDGPTLLTIPGIGAVRPLICYEGIFAEEVRVPSERPDVMVLITNDAWFGTGPGPYQHLEQAQLRAIELGVPMLRSANSGISAVIDGQGRIVAQRGLGEAGALDAPIPPVLDVTIYAQTGDFPSLFAAFVLVLASAYAGRQKGIDPGLGAT